MRSDYFSMDVVVIENERPTTRSPLEVALQGRPIAIGRRKGEHLSRISTVYEAYNIGLCTKEMKPSDERLRA